MDKKIEKKTGFEYMPWAFLTGFLAFLGIWIYALTEWGLLIGLLIGWLPALIGGFILGLLWPIVAIIIAIFIFLLLIGY